MYDSHVPVISAAMRADPECFERGVRFALLSIQQMFVTLPASMADVDKNGDQSPYLFGTKAKSYRWLLEHRDELWAEVCKAETIEAGIRAMSQMPGIGIVKAGFICQLMGYDVACLDTRNIQRDGRDPNYYKTPAAKRGPKYERLLREYVKDTGGKAREYWDIWCNEVGTAYRGAQGGEAVSKLHLDCIVPQHKREGLTPSAVPCVAADADDMPF